MVAEALEPSYCSLRQTINNNANTSVLPSPSTPGADVAPKGVDHLLLSKKLGSGWGQEFLRYQSMDNSVTYSGVGGENQSTSVGGDSGSFLADSFAEEVNSMAVDPLSSIVSNKGGFLIDRQNAESDKDVKMKLLKGLIDNGVHVEDKSIVLIDPQPISSNYDALWSVYGSASGSVPVVFSINSRSNTDGVLTQAAALKGCMFVCDFSSDVKDLIAVLDTTPVTPVPQSDPKPVNIVFDGGGVKTTQGLNSVLNGYGVGTVIVDSVEEARKVNKFASLNKKVSLVLRIVTSSNLRGFSRLSWLSDIEIIQKSCTNCTIVGISATGVSNRLELVSQFANDCSHLFEDLGIEVVMFSLPSVAGSAGEADLKLALNSVSYVFPRVHKFVIDVSDYIFKDTVSLALKVFARRLPGDFQQLIGSCTSYCSDTSSTTDETTKNFVSLSREDSALLSTPATVSSETGKSDVCHVYFIADGIYGFCNSIIYSNAKLEPQVLYQNKLLLLSQLQNSSTDNREEVLPDVSNFETTLYPSKVFGQTCDGLDCVVESIQLPILSVGDWLWIPDFGSKSTVVATTFNGFDAGFKIYCRIRDC